MDRRPLALAVAPFLAGCFSAYVAGQGAYVSELGPVVPAPDAAPSPGGEASAYAGLGVARGDSALGIGANARGRFTTVDAGGDVGLHLYAIAPLALTGKGARQDSLSALGRAVAWLGGSGQGFRWSHALEAGLLFCPQAHTTTRYTLGKVRLGSRHDTQGICVSVTGFGEVDAVTPGPSVWVAGAQAGLGWFGF